MGGEKNQLMNGERLGSDEDEMEAWGAWPSWQKTWRALCFMYPPVQYPPWRLKSKVPQRTPRGAPQIGKKKKKTRPGGIEVQIDGQIPFFWQ